jgi:hypothetical protein
MGSNSSQFAGGLDCVSVCAGVCAMATCAMNSAAELVASSRETILLLKLVLDFGRLTEIVFRSAAKLEKLAREADLSRAEETFKA